MTKARSLNKDKNKNSLKKKLKEEGIQLTADEQIEEALSQSKIKSKKDAKRKTRIKQGGLLAFLAFLGYAIYFLFFATYQGTMAFGVCKVFLELNVRFPQHLRLSTVEEFETSVRIWYTQLDSFGEYRLEPMQCYFRADEELGFVLDKVTVRRRQVDPDRVASFNKTLPVILANPPDLTYPIPISDNLRNMHIDITPFLKPIL